MDSSSNVNSNKISNELYGVQFMKSFKFNSSHFTIYNDGTREPLHGHNYKVSVKILSQSLNEENSVVSFEVLREIMTTICGGLKHCLLLPKLNDKLTITEKDEYTTINCVDGTSFTIPSKDVKLIESKQISPESLAKIITLRLVEELKVKVPKLNEQKLNKITMKVFEDSGECGIYILNSLFCDKI